MATNTNSPIIPVSEAKRFIIDCLMTVGASKENAEAQAKLLIEADQRGHKSHGMNRLHRYVHAIKEKQCDPKAVPEILTETACTAWVDGHSCLGATDGIFCMELAIKKAKEVGVGWVASKNCNHNGIQAIYCLMAIKEGLVGMAFTNTGPLLSPTRAKGAALGTNPIGFGAPAKGDDYFLLDIATTVVAFGKIEMQKRKGQPIPTGWAEDRNGQTTTDPDVAMEAKCLMPLGGSEENSGYKGTGLAILVDVLCGITAGSKFGPFIKFWEDEEKGANLGHCYIAMDPKCFAPGFEERMSTLLDYIRNMEPADPDKPVLIPGDWEKNNMLETEKIGGIQYIQDQLDSCAKISEEYGVAPLKDIHGNPVYETGSARDTYAEGKTNIPENGETEEQLGCKAKCSNRKVNKNEQPQK